MIYQHKIRMEPVPIFGAFDAPDAGQTMPRRKQSTTAIQALNLFNSPFVNDQATPLPIASPKKPASTPANRSRMPSNLPPVEAKAAIATVESHGLATLYALLNSNEFLFIP